MPERTTLCHALATLLLCSLACSAQTRKGPEPQPPQQIVRAVAVYEWTGERDKPTAARLVPVSLYINDAFEDAALYLSRPVPFALQTDIVYEAQTAGIAQGLLTLQTAAHMRGSNPLAGIDDGWFGYGTWKPQPLLTMAASAAPSNAHMLSQDGRPHFGKTDAATSPASPAAASPTTTNSTQSTDDKKSSINPSTDSTTATTPTGREPAGDADRPTLRKATPQPTRQQGGRDEASVTDAGGLLGDDPNRPHLHKGGTEKAAGIPPLKGLPADMKQLVAVSDATDRPEHDFAYDWPDAASKATALATMETLARTALAAQMPASPPTPLTPAHSASKHHHSEPLAPQPPPIALLDEDLRAFEISYGGVDVFVFSARTIGENAVEHYVTLVAAPDIYNKTQILLQSVTDSSHLEQSPRMRLIDAVDADADNRAELLFELRGQNERQFALYRVAQGTVQQAYLGGTTQ